MDAYTALALSEATAAAWTQHMVSEKAESLLASLNSKPGLSVTLKDEGVVQVVSTLLLTESTLQQAQANSHYPDRGYLARSLVTELGSQVLLFQAKHAEAAYVVKSTQVEPHPPEDEATETHTHTEEYTESMVQDMLSQLLSSVATQAEARNKETYPVDTKQDTPESATLEPLPHQREEGVDPDTHSEKYAESVAQELLSQLLYSVGVEAETKEGMCPASMLLESAIDVDTEADCLSGSIPTQDEAIFIHTNLEQHMAESMVHELLSQQLYLKACDAEARFINSKGTTPSHHATDTDANGEETEFAVTLETIPLNVEAINVHRQPEGYIAESAVQELLSQLLYTAACKAEAKFIELSSSRTAVYPASVNEDEQTDSLETPLELSAEFDPRLTSFDRSYVVTVSDAATNTESNAVSIGMCTEPKSVKEVETCTEPRLLEDKGTSMEPRPLKEVGCNTFVNCLDVLRRAKEMEELNMLKADHLVNVKQLNEERSKRMVAEQLVKIVQSDVSELRQRNVSEVTIRMRLENELGDAKAELSYTNKQLEEKEQRIKELEESLTGSSLLVRKLEEQNSISLMNRGGIDYMVQAKLAEGRAREAEQKLEVVQSELLQAQTEVRLLLDRVSEAAREKTESVSSKVHTQLLQLADDRAMAAESRVQDLEREVRALKERLSSRESSGSTGPYGSPYGPTLSSLTSSSSYLPQSSFGMSTLYPATHTTLGSAYSRPGYPSYESPSYLLPSSLKSYDYLGRSHDSMGQQAAEPKSYDYLGRSHDPMGQRTAEPKSHDYLGRSHDPIGQQATEPKSHDYLGKSYDPIGAAEATKTKPHDILETKAHDFTPPRSHDYHELSHDSKPKPATPPPRDVELPLVSSIEKSGVADKTSHVTTKFEKEDSGSSDWSSSEDEEGLGDSLAPTSHRTLISQWEWRTMNKETPTSSQTASTLAETAPTLSQVSPTPSQATPTHAPGKKRPPPIAPKPKNLTISQQIFASEPPSSFSEPVHAPSLVSSRRVKGPPGRRLPVRFSK